MAKYTLFAKGGNVKGQKKLKDGNYASHKVSLEQDGKSKKYFVAYVNEGDDRTANFYDMTGKFVMDMKVSDGGKLVSEGKMKKMMDYEVPKDNVKVRDISLKDMNYSELRQYIQDKYIDNLKDAEFYFNIYETGDSIEFVDESIRDQHKNIFEDNADYLEKDFEKKTGLKIDGFEILDDDGNELEEVTSGNTYNWGYLGGADFNYRVYKTSDGEKYYLMALIHMGGDIRGNYGDAFIFEGDSEDEVLMKFQGLLSGGGYIHLRFKDGSSVSFDSQQDSDVWYFEQHERNDEPVTGLAKQYLDDFESFGSWDGDGFLEATVEEFHQGKKVHSYERGGPFEVGRFYKNKEGNVYRYLGSKYFMGQDGQYKKLEVDDFYGDGGDVEYAKGGGVDKKWNGRIVDQYANIPKEKIWGKAKNLWNAWTKEQRRNWMSHNISFRYGHGWDIEDINVDTIYRYDWDYLQSKNENFVKQLAEHINRIIKDGQYARGGGIGEKTLSRRYLENKGRNVFTFGYGMPKDAIDKYGTKGGAEYFELPNGEVYQKVKGTPDKFVLIFKYNKKEDGGIMAKGGQLNIHERDFKGDFTIEWDVKGLGSKANISEEDFEYEYETGAFANSYAQNCFDEIKSKVKPKSWSIRDWSFAGRSNGWFVLICDGNEDYPVSGYGDNVTDSQMDKMNSIVDKYKKNYTKELEEFYGKEKKEDGGDVEYARGGVLSHGFKTGDKILNDYLGYAIVKNTDGVSVVNPNSGSRFVISLDDSKMGGARKMIKMSEKQQIDAAIDYIDTLEPLND